MPTAIYHFTHRDNLPTILSEGHIHCERSRMALGISSRNVAYTDLKQRRSQVRVDVAPGGHLDHYVPFYFGTRSPMMLAYSSGRVTGRPEDLDELVYLATTVETIQAAGVRFVFTDGHPVRMPRFFSNDVADLSRVDFRLMVQKMWNDTNEDPDRMRRRQAEFLVHKSVSWTHIAVLGTRTPAVATAIKTLIAQQTHRPRVLVRPDWYY